jgi:hypothetical protein
MALRRALHRAAKEPLDESDRRVQRRFGLLLGDVRGTSSSPVPWRSSSFVQTNSISPRTASSGATPATVSENTLVNLPGGASLSALMTLPSVALGSLGRTIGQTTDSMARTASR